MMDENNSSQPSSLHTLGNPHAEWYISNCLSEEGTQPLLNADIMPPDYSPVPRNSDERLFQNQYYCVQQSTELNKFSKKNENCGMSPVRRMFCLLALFDGLLSFLMWIIYVQISGGILIEELKKEVEDFKFRKSYFDVVGISAIRSIFLFSIYGCCCKSSKWYAVAISTAASTIHLLVKVFLASFKTGQPMNYILLIFSFIICWCEAWHFDFQVVPHEMDDDKIPASLVNSAGGSNGMLPDISTKQRIRCSGPKSSAFFTPYAGSIFTAHTPCDDSSSLSDLSVELDSALENDRKLIQIANDTVHLVFGMLYVNDGWSLDREEHDNITIQSREFQGVGKVYKLEALLDVPKNVLDKLFWEDVDSQPSWNTSVKESQIVRKINNKTEILYTVVAEIGSGIIASRDFVCLRRRKRKDTLTLLCMQSIETDLVPQNKSIIRGINGPGGWILREIPSEPNKTEFTWLLNTDLKGWLPQRLVEQSIAGVMIETCRDIYQHASTLAKT